MVQHYRMKPFCHGWVVRSLPGSFVHVPRKDTLVGQGIMPAAWHWEAEAGGPRVKAILTRSQICCWLALALPTVQDGE